MSFIEAVSIQKHFNDQKWRKNLTWLDPKIYSFLKMHTFIKGWLPTDKELIWKSHLNQPKLKSAIEFRPLAYYMPTKVNKILGLAKAGLELT